jgi:two-component system sensor histidine kinase HydH
MVRDALPNATEGPEDTQLANSAEILDQCLASGILAIDGQSRLTSLSPAAEEVLGLSAAACIGKSIEVLPASIRAVLQRSLSTGQPVSERQLALPGVSGGERILRICTTLSHNADGQPAGVVAVVNNVTPARLLDQNLRKLDRLASIGMLSASMAHEIKNAMVAVKTFVDLLIKENQEASLADIAGREMHRIDSIVSQMLRIGGPARPTFGVIHLHQVIEQSLGLVQHHLEGRRINLVRTLQAAPDIVRADAYQLEQAFINLFFNALDAMGATGELNVVTELVPPGGAENPNAPMLRVTVQDTGMGIPQENLDRLFEPFFTTKANGTGLGLPITRRIVQEHRGIITVASELHKGTTFTLLLPSAAKQP